MGRLIDADVLFKAYENIGWYNNADRDEIAEKILLEQPIVEAVEVVRCKNCVYYKAGGCRAKETIVIENEFCSWGQRREDGKTD